MLQAPMPLIARLRKYEPHLKELALIFGAYLVYLFARGLVYSDTTATGTVNARSIVGLERALGFFWEPVWQAWMLQWTDLVGLFFNWVYLATYWPLILVGGAVLFLTDRSAYYYYRSTVLVSLAIALCVFTLFPVTSPFNLTEHLSNTIQDLGPKNYGSPEMAVFYNTDAAMPSLHFCWSVIMGVMFWGRLKGAWKALGIAYPVLTFLSIIVTGNHFVLDAIAGGVLAAFSFGLVALWNKKPRWKSSQPTGAF